RLLHGNLARTRCIKHQADGIGTGVSSRPGLGGRTKPADFNPYPLHDALFYLVTGSGVAGGMPKCSGYSTRRRLKPLAGAVMPAWRRSPVASTCASQDGARRPSPTSSRLPTMLRTM